MRAKVENRNRRFYYPQHHGKPGFDLNKCDICGFEDNSKYFKNAHLIAHEHSDKLTMERKNRDNDNGLPDSPASATNGLFLCPSCDQYFEDFDIKITGKGVIVVDTQVMRRRNILSLNGRKVVWADKIGTTNWPTKDTLDFRNTLLPVSNHRSKGKFRGTVESNDLEDDDSEEFSDSDSKDASTVRPLTKKGMVNNFFEIIIY